MDPFTQSCQMIWKWNVSVQSLSHGCWIRIKWKLVCWLRPNVLKRAQRTRRFLRQSLLVMRPGCTPTTQTKNCSYQNGTQRPLLDQRKHVMSNPKQKCCSLCFSTTKVWCTMNLYQLDKLLTALSTCRFWNDWGRQSEENVLRNGKEDGHWITTMLPPTHRLLCGHGSQKQTFHSSTTHPTHRI